MVHRQGAAGWAAGVIAAIGLAGCGQNQAETGSEAVANVATTIAAAQQNMQDNLPDAAKGAPAPNEEKLAECLLWPGNYRGDCIFEPRGKGSFAVRRPDGETFYDDVAEVRVMIYAEGQADVRSFDKDGESRRWGDAERSEGYPACWIGHKFSVCAY
ncbi:MAG: hypothetical protein V2I43_08680 [Parvularcula sp.]|jgi:hypothetical protein|nr:hypothetical protein [Parvularcula sp.]